MGPPRALADDLARCAEAIRRGVRFLVSMHQYPDGDALGSALGLAQALREMGKDVVVYNPHRAAGPYAFLPGAEAIATALPRDAEFDVSIACDAGDRSRLGPDFPPPPRCGRLVNLDHHRTTPHFGDVNVIDPDAAAVGVIVYRLLGALGHRVTPDTGTCLYASIFTDTGSFRHANTGAEALRIAADLVAAGVRPAEVASRLYQSESASRLRLLAEVLGTLEVGAGGRWAGMTATRAMYARAGTREETADGFINFPRAITGVEVAVLFREEDDGRVRVSLRSRGRVDVSAVATPLGGGGHHDAAGCTVLGSLAEVRGRVLAAVEAAIRISPPGPGTPNPPGPPSLKGRGEQGSD